MAAAEQKKSYAVVKQFRGLNTKANRTAIDESEFAWLENAQPIGYANLKIIPNSEPVVDGSANAVVFSNTVTHLTSVNIGLNDYVVAFMDDGSAQYFNISTDTFGNVASAGTFSASGINTTQWNNERMLILDPSKGYFSWDSNNVVTIGSVGTIGIVNQGSGYTEAPTVTISAPDETGGVQANATATISTANVVTSIALSNAGTGYTNAANLTITFSGGGGGTGANAVAQLLSFKTGTLSLVVVNGGSGYINAANTTVSISGGGGAGATAVPIVVGNVVTQVIMTNQGSGYTIAQFAHRFMCIQFSLCFIN
jgi:hypothetical protein